MPEMAIRQSVRDEKKVNQAIEKLLLHLGAAASGGKGGEVSMETEKVGDRDIYRIKFGGQMPIPMGLFLTFDRGDLVVAGFSESALTNALKAGQEKVTSLPAQEEFISARKKLPAKAAALTYEDTPAVFEMNYQEVMMQTQMMAGVGRKSPWMANLPPASAIKQYLFPGASVVTTEPEGILLEGYASVPGISSAPVILQVPLIFQMFRSMGQAKAAWCQNNLKQIGLAAHIYASEHKGAFPSGRTASEAISELIAGNYLPMAGYEQTPLFVCPSAEADKKAWERMKKLTIASCSYGWVSGLTVNSPPDFILAYDKSAGFHGGRRNVLFVDGRVETLSEEEFQKRMAEQKGKAGPMRGKLGGGE